MTSRRAARPAPDNPAGAPRPETDASITGPFLPAGTPGVETDELADEGERGLAEDVVDAQAPTAGLDDLARQGLDLRLACQRIARRVRYEATAGSVAPHHIAVLARLEEGDLPPGEIAALERVSAPSMTRTVTRLVAEGLVRRTKHPTDGRVVLVGLTDTGQALLDEARQRRDLWMTSRLRQLDPSDVELVPEMVRILTRVAAL